jgi:hypothetical protein
MMLRMMSLFKGSSTMSSNLVGRYFSTHGVELELDALDALDALVAAIFKLQMETSV